MASFLFNTLPMELRLMIWEQALVQEASGRMVIHCSHTGRFVPTKHLVSSLLSVNKESRKCALKFFNMRLAVAPLPKPIMNRRFVRRVGEVPVRAKLHHPRVDEKNHGFLYLSLQHDVFIPGFRLIATKENTLSNGGNDTVLNWSLGFEQLRFKAGAFPAYVTSAVWGSGRYYAIEMEKVLAIRNIPLQAMNHIESRPDTDESYYKRITSGLRMRKYFYHTAMCADGKCIGDWINYLAERRSGEPLAARYSLVDELPSILQEDEDGEQHEVPDPTRFHERGTGQFCLCH